MLSIDEYKVDLAITIAKEVGIGIDTAVEWVYSNWDRILYTWNLQIDLILDYAWDELD